MALPLPPRSLLLLLLLPHQHRQRKKRRLRPRLAPALPRTKKIPMSVLPPSSASSLASITSISQKLAAPGPEAASPNRTCSISSSTVRLLQLQCPHRVSPQPLRRLTRCRHCNWSSRTVLRSEEHTSELQSLTNVVCRLLP